MSQESAEKPTKPETTKTASADQRDARTEKANTESSTTAASDSEAEPLDAWASLPIGLDPTRVIDLAIEQAWREHDLQAAPAADDAAFMRRLYLDLIGRIPRAGESAKFLSSTDSRKRELLVDALLASEEHAQHFAEIFDALLIGRSDVEQVKRRSDAGWLQYLQRSFQENRPWDQVAREVLLARPATPEQRGATWYLVARKNKPQDIAEAVSKDFFGVRIDCAQCHDHPLSAEIEQRHYWGLVAFFNRSKNTDSPNGPRVAESAIGGFSDFANLEGETKPNELVFLGDRHVEEPRPAQDAKEEDRDDLYLPSTEGEPRSPKFSRREQFVDKVLKDHPLVAQAMVNRLWGWMLGRGLVHPVDAMDSFHPASHPGLLDWLGRDFAASGYDVRRLLKSLALSRPYQLASAQERFADPQWFSAALVKPLNAEALHRSLLQVMEPEDAGRWNTVEYRVAFAKQFPDVLAEESLATVSQGLLLTNGEAINKIVSVEHSRLLRSLVDVPDNQVVIQRLFQSVFGRQPDAEELQRAAEFIESRDDHREQAIEGLAWSLVTSAEFRFNH